MPRRRITSDREKDVEAKFNTEEKTALVVSAIQLSPFQCKEIEVVISRHLGGKYRVENRVDESVIGGMYIKIGDRVIDATLRLKIENLKERLLP